MEDSAEIIISETRTRRPLFCAERLNRDKYVEGGGSYLGHPPRPPMVTPTKLEMKIRPQSDDLNQLVNVDLNSTAIR